MTRCNTQILQRYNVSEISQTRVCSGPFLITALQEKSSFMAPHLLSAIGMPQGVEWIVILIIGLLLFGNRLPAMMRGLGGSINEFKKGMEDGDPRHDKMTEEKSAKEPFKE